MTKSRYAIDHAEGTKLSWASSITSWLLSFFHLAEDAFGNPLTVGKRVRLATPIHDGVGPDREEWGELYPCANDSPHPRVLALRAREPGITQALLQIGEHRAWVDSRALWDYYDFLNLDLL